MTDPAPPGGENPQLTSAVAGALMESLYVKRTVKVLAVQEHEVNDISFMNTLATLAFSVASAFIAFAVGIFTAAAFADKLTPSGTAALELAGPLCLVVALIAAILGCVSIGRRKSALKLIKEQSQTVAP